MCIAHAAFCICQIVEIESSPPAKVIQPKVTVKVWVFRFIPQSFWGLSVESASQCPTAAKLLMVDSRQIVGLGRY